MTTESIRESFEAWLSRRRISPNCDPMYLNTCDAMFAAFHAATLAERERCANVCKESADRLESSQKRLPQVDAHVVCVLRGRAEAIRKGE